MKRITKILFVLIVLISLMGCKSKEEKMLDYMQNRYGEEFVLGFAGGRGDKLMVETMPKRYLGTPKENDQYYHGTIFYRPYKIGDNYGAVIINEGANEYVRPKLEELFGKNILIALNLEGYYEKINFKEEMERRKALYKADPEGEYFPLSGGIYIFGRVENEKDREKYRKGIYEFIQYLKQEGMFEYTKLIIAVGDERALTKEFRNNYNNIRERLSNIPSGKEISRHQYSSQRVKVMSELNKSFELKKDYSDVINQYSRSKITKNWGEEVGDGVTLLLTEIMSPKFIKSKGLDKDPDPKVHRDIKNYDKISDVKLLEGW